MAARNDYPLARAKPTERQSRRGVAVWSRARPPPSGPARTSMRAAGGPRRPPTPAAAALACHARAFARSRAQRPVGAPSGSGQPSACHGRSPDTPHSSLCDCYPARTHARHPPQTPLRKVPPRPANAQKRPFQTISSNSKAPVTIPDLTRRFTGVYSPGMKTKLLCFIALAIVAPLPLVSGCANNPLHTVGVTATAFGVTGGVNLQFSGEQPPSKATTP